MILGLTIIGTIAAVICAITGVISVWDRLKTEWSAKWFLGSLIVAVVAVGALDFDTRLKLQNAATASNLQHDWASVSGWPLPDQTALSDLADDLRPYQPEWTTIVYDDAQEEPLALAFAKAMHKANWREPSMTGQLSEPRLGITIWVGPDVAGTLEPLKKFCRKQLKTEPTIATGQVGISGTGYASPKSIELVIGHNESE